MTAPGGRAHERAGDRSAEGWEGAEPPGTAGAEGAPFEPALDPGVPVGAAEPGTAAVPAEGVDGPDGEGGILAEPGQRLLARVADTLVVGLPVVLILREVLPHETADRWSPTLVASVLLVYDAVQVALWGRTLGKRLAGVRVVTEDGSRPDAVRAGLRAAVYAVPIALRPVPVLGLLAGFFWVVNAALALRGPERRAVHDRLAGTGVVKNTFD
ncbi:RDD family protein [Actinomadura logoneensis]|uniref:RDD family protein n=1 Tax=Actinomadura logoneensis TaxID=2293572 RepID=A0A372JSU3_9ACTN|nr:RDD family protein [Actinomadura logoneensis]RFU43102.1 RDD family protein [Actinomadura logoneensis]